MSQQLLMQEFHGQGMGEQKVVNAFWSAVVFHRFSFEGKAGVRKQTAALARYPKAAEPCRTPNRKRVNRRSDSSDSLH